MLQIERRIETRFPDWFRGRRGRLARPLVRTLGRWSGLESASAFLAANATLRGQAFVAAALRHLQADYRVEPEDLARIPASGRLLVVANHPSGALDALALLHLLGRVRSDVRIVANDLLAAIPNLEGMILPVRILGGRPDPESLRAVSAALEADQCVVIFPAGEVSRLGWRGVRDGRWRKGVVHFARATGARVLPVGIAARNSALFYGASALFKAAGTALLAREMFARRRRMIQLNVGAAGPLPSGDVVLVLDQLRRYVHALARLKPADATGAVAQPAPVADPTDARMVEAAVDELPLLGRTADGMRIHAGRLAADSPLLREIGRVRECAFRAVGEGTGRSLDLDAYDCWYEHIVLWDPAARRIAGAYRAARGAPVLAAQGLAGLYTASLFRYSDAAIPRIAEGMELGRSFVAPDYQGSRSIDYLWQGIGAYLRAHPGVRYLFGAVSISAALPDRAREQIVAYYAHYYGMNCDRGGEAVAVPQRPFAYRSAPAEFAEIDAATAFGVLKANLSAIGASVPMLYKQYTELCEPGGARFLAFGVDPGFSDSIDGLIEVDLQRMRPHKRRRYLGSPAIREEADA